MASAVSELGFRPACIMLLRPCLATLVQCDSVVLRAQYSHDTMLIK